MGLSWAPLLKIIIMVTAIFESVSSTWYFGREKNYTHIPDDIPNGATVVKLGENQITSLDHSLPVTVTELSLIDNDITTIPDYIFSALAQLNVLSLHNNKVHWIGPHAFAGTQLEDLFLGGNQLQAVPDLSDIRLTISEVFLFGNDISEVPPSSIGGLTLENFDLSNNNLGTFPDPRESNASLNWLGLRDNPLSCDPSLCWIMDAQTSKRITVFLYRTTCAEPKELAGKMWRDLQPVDIKCPGATAAPTEVEITTTSQPALNAGSQGQGLHIGRWLGVIAGAALFTV